MGIDNMSILVLSFDGYSDLWEAFFVTKNKYWRTCKYKARLVSNYKIYPGVETICVGKEICWSDRALKALEYVREPYVMLLLEDYLFASEVKDKEIDDAINYIVENDINYMRIVTIPKSKQVSADGDGYIPIYANEEYGVNLQASIWKTSYLKESIKRFYGSPWDFEIGFLADTMNSSAIPLRDCYTTEHNLIDIKNGVLKGKWFPSVLRYYSKRGINFKWENRGKLSFYNECKYGLKVKLKNILGYKARRIIKRLLVVLGVKFVSKY